MVGCATKDGLVALLLGLLLAGCPSESADPVDPADNGGDGDGGPDLVTPDVRRDVPPATCTDQDPTGGEEPWLRVSSGFHTYECLEDGAEVPMIMGIQGGYHIWGAFRAGGFEAGDDWYYTMDFTYEQAGEIVAEAHYTDVIRRAGVPDGGPYQYDSVAVIFHDELLPEERLSVPGILRLRLWRENSVDLSAEIELVPNEITF